MVVSYGTGTIVNGALSFVEITCASRGSAGTRLRVTRSETQTSMRVGINGITNATYRPVPSPHGASVSFRQHGRGILDDILSGGPESRYKSK